MEKLFPKLIRLDDADKEEIEKIAKTMCMSSNQLIRFIIKDWLKSNKKEK